MPRWLWTVCALQQNTAPAGGLSPSAQDLGAMCQLRPPMPRQRRVIPARARRRWLSLGRKLSTQACCARVPCHAGCGRLMLFRRALRQQEAPPVRHMTAVRRASCGLEQTEIQRRVSRATHRRACACRLWGGGAARRPAFCARAPCHADLGLPIPCKSVSFVSVLCQEAQCRFSWRH